jgi:hypothetical protein
MTLPPVGAVVLRRRLEIAAGGLSLGLTAGVVGAVDPETSGAYPVCPFRALTGLACPGCGSLRALHDLVHGSPMSALDHNALFVVALVVAALLSTRAFVRPEPLVMPPWLPRAVLVGLVVWTVLRNLPMAPFAVLAP